MPEPINDRVCAEADGDIVLFLIGMRLNRPWKFWKFLPVLRAMSRMIAELTKNPALGLLHARGHYGPPNLMMLQYWQSAAHLLAYAKAADKQHLPAWQDFNRAIGTSGDVGIWHETYVVPRGQMESIYVNMPPHGLGLAGNLSPATDNRASAAKRLKIKD